MTNHSGALPVLADRQSEAELTLEGLKPNDPNPHKQFADKILHILSVYPKLSPSMLQMGIGGNQSPRKWHPALDDLITSGQVRRDIVEKMSPAGRRQRYIILSLA